MDSAKIGEETLSSVVSPSAEQAASVSISENRRTESGLISPDQAEDALSDHQPPGDLFADSKESFVNCCASRVEVAINEAVVPASAKEKSDNFIEGDNLSADLSLDTRENIACVGEFVVGQLEGDLDSVNVAEE